MSEISLREERSTTEHEDRFRPEIQVLVAVDYLGDAQFSGIVFLLRFVRPIYVSTRL